MKLTEKQLRILQHSLGLDGYGQGRQYRNHYVAPNRGAESEVLADLDALAAAGYMINRGVGKLTGGGECFVVTDDGIEAVKTQSPSPPKRTRSQERYRRYLDSDGVFENFRAFLGYEKQERDARRLGFSGVREYEEWITGVSAS